MRELGYHGRHICRIGNVSAICLLLGVMLTACSGSTGSTTIQTTATPHVTATTPSSSTPSTGPAPTMEGLAWVQPTPTGKPQIWASIGGKPGRMIMQATGDDCDTSELGPPVLSPDAKHIVIVGGAGCGDGQSHGPVFVVNVAAGTMTPIANTNVLTNERSVGWLNNDTLFFASGAVNMYRISSATVAALPGTNGAVEATVRGSQLFYITFTRGNMLHVLASLHRYNLISQRDVTVIDLGTFDLPAGQSPPDYHSEGWDASLDGTHVVYQVTTSGPVQSAPVGISSSRIYYASADNSAQSQILQFMTTNNLVRLHISPNGKEVAVTEATPAPDIISGCVNSPGATPQSDPCFHSYALPQGFFSGGYAVWSPDGTAFIVAAYGDPPGNGLYRFTVGAPSGTLVQPGAYNPWAS